VIRTQYTTDPMMTDSADLTGTNATFHIAWTIASLGNPEQKLIQMGSDIRQISHDLHPPVLQEAGLPEAIRAYCEQFAVGSAIAVSFEGDEAARELSRGAALALYRVVQEALGNAAKHAAARHVNVRLTRSNGVVSLTVTLNDAEPVLPCASVALH